MTEPEPPPTAISATGLAAVPVWAQRVLFFALGLSMPFKAARWIADVLPGPDGIQEVAVEAFFGVSLLVLRLRRGPQWRWLSYSLGVAVTWLALCAFLFGAPAIEDWINERDFDAAAWRSAKLGTSETRVWMVDDLLAHHSPVGRPVAEIDDLLGTDDSVRGTKYGAGYWDEWDRVWWLGPERGFIRIDSEWLVLRVDTSGGVTEVKLVRD